MTDIDFAMLRPRESMSLAKFTTNQDEDLLYVSPSANK